MLIKYERLLQPPGSPLAHPLGSLLAPPGDGRKLGPQRQSAPAPALSPPLLPGDGRKLAAGNLPPEAAAGNLPPEGLSEGTSPGNKACLHQLSAAD